MNLKGAICGAMCGAITLIAHNCDAQGLISVSGEVLASTPCELAPPSDSVVCPQVVLPIQAAILAQRTQGRRRVSRMIYSTADGYLTARLTPGKYSLKLRRAQIAESFASLEPKKLRLSPAKFLVKADSPPIIILVTHKDRTPPSITIGFAK